MVEKLEFERLKDWSSDKLAIVAISWRLDISDIYGTFGTYFGHLSDINAGIYLRKRD